MATKRSAGVLQKAGVFNRGGADDDVAQTGVQIALDRVQVAYAAAQLHVNFQAHFSQYFFDRQVVFRNASERAVEVDQVQPARTLVDPVAGHGRRVFAENG